MLRYCLCALAGAYALSCAERLPGPIMLAAAILLGLLSLPWAPTRPLAAFLGGALLLWFASRAELAARLPLEQVGKDITFDAEIIDFSTDRSAYTRLLVAPAGSAGLPARVRLNWYGAEREPRLGERWRLTARLKRPRGFLNPGGFDYAGWLYRQRIGATGYVVAGTLVEDAPRRTPRLRRAFVERVDGLLPGDDASAVLLAITVGARHRVSRDAWERYARTGTTHLMAISGLHVGLAAGAAFALGRFLFALFAPRVNARDAALVLALAAAAAYAEISGFAVPARRALLMAALAAAAMLLRQRPSLRRILALACLAVMVADPLSLLAPGFKLSFAAVALLFLIGAQRPRGKTPVSPWSVRGLFRGAAALGRLQLALLFGLLPLTALLFARASWLAPLANLLVLPVFSFVTVPTALAGLAAAGPFAAIGDALLLVSWHSLKAVVAILDLLAGLPGARLALAAPRGLAIPALCLAAVWVLLPPGMPGRRLAWPALVAAVLYRPAPPPAGCVDLTVLDVGQGLAAVLETSRRLVVFDTGPAFAGGSDTAELVVLPYLESIGRRSVDLAIVSHGDQDHAGGLASLTARTDVRQVLAGEPDGTGTVPEFRCLAGTGWRWDGIDFEILYPEAGDRRDGNNASCVLEVAAGPHRLLLTGDIERPVERRLVERGRLEQSAVVVVPHHGSRTSSSLALVRAVTPRHAIVSAGYGNRWGFPKAEVVARWEDAGATVSSTADAGAVSVRVCSDSGVARIVHWRERLRRYWHD